MTQEKMSRTRAAKRPRYRSVAEMVRDLSEDGAFAEGVERRIAERHIINYLMALRSALAVSQKDIAAKMACTQSRISKLENGTDDDLRLGDFQQYAQALGMDLMIVLAKKGRTIVDDIKFHALSMKRLLDRLTKLAEKDKSIAQGVECFIAGEAYYNINKMLLEAAERARKSARNIPPQNAKSHPCIQIEVQDDDLQGVSNGCEVIAAT